MQEISKARIAICNKAKPVQENGNPSNTNPKKYVHHPKNIDLIKIKLDRYILRKRRNFHENEKPLLGMVEAFISVRPNSNLRRPEARNRSDE
ncbi:MAG: hypothetical protein HQM08_03950 [Candidatus Riflebacteria bacterium]|nr:hypothetical protein [Candidatus Riflebacteria bacterium]